MSKIDEILGICSSLETKFGFKESNSYGTPFFNKGESKSWMNYPKNSFNKIEDLYGDLMSKFKYF